MEKQTMGEIICTLRKQKGMTQKELAEKMGVTDKAVSKWERNLSCPDIASVPKLAEALDTSVEVLMDVKPKEETETPSAEKMVDLVLKTVPFALSIAVLAGSALNKLEAMDAVRLLGVGLFFLAVRVIREK